MKKRLLCAFIFLTLLVGCSSQPLPQKSTSISDEEVKALYEQAVTLYSWFDLSSLPVDTSQKATIDGETFFKVSAEVATYQELETRLTRIFDDQIVNDLMSRGIYTDYQGSLYAKPADRGTNRLRGAEVHSINRRNDKEIEYCVKVEILDDKGAIKDYEHYCFRLVKYKDAAWRFSSFELVRYLDSRHS